MAQCRICGEYECKKHTMFLGKVRKIREFSGSSPPEVFVGRWGYPNVNVGILSPEEHGNTKIMSSAEEWHSKKLGIRDVINLRNKLIYGRVQNNVKNALNNGNFINVLQEVAMTSKSIASEFVLKKPISRNYEKENSASLIANAASVESVKLQENPKIEKKVDYIVNDSDIRSKDALLELEKGRIDTSSIIKLLSAGLLGLRKNRKLVPTRWSITAVDDTLSNEKIDKIKYYPHISEYMVFHDEYIGNHYEILLMPRYWSFEVVEISLKSSGVWRDSETIFKRKKYAESVTGAYYANRLAVTEYLERIGKQASVFIFREVRPEYYAPLGVGILRETTRSAMRSGGKRFGSLKEALEDIQTRLRIPIERYLRESFLMKEMQQKSLSDF